MLDIGWSELLVIGVVALLVVGPKELPVMLRVIGRYVAMVKRQADEFRAQFSEAMQQADIEQLRKDVTDIKAGAEETLRDVKNSFDEGLEDAPLKSDKEKLEDAKRKTDAKAIDEAFDDDFEEPVKQPAAAAPKPNGATPTEHAAGGSAARPEESPQQPGEPAKPGA